MANVIAASVKAAVANHVLKQARAFGAQVDQGVTVWSGKTAYAVYRTNVSRTGEISCRFRVNYPALHDDAHLTRGEADLIAAYTLHELGHVVYTSNWIKSQITRGSFYYKPANSFGAVFPYFNGLEDGRMENCVIKSGHALNSRRLFKRLLNKLTVDLPQSWNPCSLGDAPFALAILAREWYGNGNAYSKNLIDRIPEPKRSVYIKALDALVAVSLDNKGSEICFEIADRFLTEFKLLDASKTVTKVNSPPPPPEPEEDYWKDEGETEDSAEESFEDPDEILESESEPEGPVAPPPGDDEEDDYEDDLDGEPGSGSGEPDDSDDSDEPGEPVESDEPGEPSESGEPGESGEGSEGSDDDVESAPGDGFTDVADNSGKVSSPEPNIDDLFKRANKRNGKQEGESAGWFVPANRVLPSWRLDGRISEDWVRRTWENNYRSTGIGFPEVDKVNVPGLKTLLSRLLVSVDQVGWQKGCLAGRFDVRRSHRLAANSEAVFKRRWEAESIETALSIVIDMSGSMSGEQSFQAFKAAWAIAEAAERVGAKNEVLGFVDGTAFNNYRPEASLDGEWKRQSERGAARGAAADLSEIKKFTDKMTAKVKENFTVSQFDCRSGTPDYSAVRSAVEQLSLRSEKRKIVLVLTDGLGNWQEMKKFTSEAFRRYNVTVLAIGIGVTKCQMESAYHLFSCINSVEELGSVAMRELIAAVKKVQPETIVH